MAAAVLLSGIVPALFVQSVTVRWAVAVTMCLLAVGGLIWAQTAIGRISAALQEVTHQAEADSEKSLRQIRDLEESRGRMELEKKNAEVECAAQAREHLGRVAEEQARTTAAVQQAEGLRSEKERLLAEHKRLELELVETSGRCRLSETRNLDSDRRLREVGDAYASSVGQLKESERELLRLKEDARALRVENESLRKNSVALQRELEVVVGERSKTELRLSQVEQELDSLRSRAEDAEKRVKYLESDQPAQEAFAARREI